MELQKLSEPANRLERVRLKFKLTYAALGEMLADEENGFKAVSPQTARKWCLEASHSERRTPRARARARIREVFGLTAEELECDLQEQGAAS